MNSGTFNIVQNVFDASFLFSDYRKCWETAGRKRVVIYRYFSFSADTPAHIYHRVYFSDNISCYEFITTLISRAKTNIGVQLRKVSTLWTSNYAISCVNAPNFKISPEPLRQLQHIVSWQQFKKYISLSHASFFYRLIFYTIFACLKN